MHEINIDLAAHMITKQLHAHDIVLTDVSKGATVPRGCELRRGLQARLATFPQLFHHLLLIFLALQQTSHLT